MDIQKAIQVLNRENHRDTDEWHLNEHDEVVSGNDLSMEYFTPFEAEAIASAYLRLRQREGARCVPVEAPSPELKADTPIVIRGATR